MDCNKFNFDGMHRKIIQNVVFILWKVFLCRTEMNKNCIFVQKTMRNAAKNKLELNIDLFDKCWVFLFAWFYKYKLLNGPLEEGFVGVFWGKDNFFWIYKFCWNLSRMKFSKLCTISSQGTAEAQKNWNRHNFW